MPIGPHMGLVEDTNFLDPSYWDVSGVFQGSAVVANGKLTVTDALGNVEPAVRVQAPKDDMELHYFEVIVDSAPIAQLTTKIEYGGEILWSGLMGAGIFSGPFYAFPFPIDSGYLRLRLISNSNPSVGQTLTISKLSVVKAGDISGRGRGHGFAYGRAR